MDERELEEILPNVDLWLAEQNVSALWRPMIAYMRITGLNKFHPALPDPNLSEYEGTNLFYRVQGWYGRHYPLHSTFQGDWGVRWFVIRGEFYQARMPIIFNPTEDLDAFEHIEHLSSSILNLLTQTETEQIQMAFNEFFWQASNINLCLSNFSLHKSSDAVSDMLERGWSDLTTAGRAFEPNDPTSVLFTIQQAAEKYLKALLIAKAEASTENELRNKYGHRIGDLFTACETITSALHFLKPGIELLSYGPDVRYHKPKLNGRDVIARINYSFAICNATAKALLQLKQQQVA